MAYRQLRNALRVYAVTDPLTPAGPRLIGQVEQAIAGGVTAVQLRDKRSAMSDVVDAGRVLRQLTSEAGVMFIVNDRVDLALALDADGVHLGQEDFPPSIARNLLGPEKVIGVSVGNSDEARPEYLDVADYVGVGPMFDTQTKQDAGHAVGPNMIRELPAPDRPAYSRNWRNRDRQRSSGIIGRRGWGSGRRRSFSSKRYRNRVA